MKKSVDLRKRGGLFGSRGSVLVYTALLMPVFIGMLALAIDIGYQAASKAEVENVAAAAALACESGLSNAQPSATTTYGKYSTAYKQAKIYASSNKVMGATITLSNSDILIGKWNHTTKTVDTDTASMLSPDACQVIIPRKLVKSIFYKALPGFANYSTKVSSKAVAQYGVTSATKSWNMAIIQDITLSMSAADIANSQTADLAILSCLQNKAGTGSQVGYVSFPNNASTTIPMADPDSSTAVDTAIDGMKRCGTSGAPACAGTNTEGAIRAGISMLKPVDASGKCTSSLGCAMTIITDGEPTARNSEDSNGNNLYPLPTKPATSAANTLAALQSFRIAQIAAGTWPEDTPVPTTIPVWSNTSSTWTTNWNNYWTTYWDNYCATPQACAVKAATLACSKGYTIYAIYFNSNGNAGSQANVKAIADACGSKGKFFASPDSTTLSSGAAGVCATIPPRLVYQN